MDRPEERELRKNVSRENSQRAWVSEGGWRKWFHVKHRGGGPENAILQNNPMH
jgi:hypothetical protein